MVNPRVKLGNTEEDLRHHASSNQSVWWSFAFLCQSGELQKVLCWMPFTQTKSKHKVNSNGLIITIIITALKGTI